MRARSLSWPSPAWIAAAVVVVMVVLAAAHGAFGTDVRGNRWHLNQEQTVPALFAALLLTAGATASALAGRANLLGTRLPWLALAVLLLVMGVDEFGEVHEKLEHRSGVDWQLLYLPVAAAGGVAWLALIRRMPWAQRLALAGGAAAWLVAFVLEDLEYKAGDVPVGHFYELAFAEELLEMAGSALFLLAIYSLLRTPGREPSPLEAGTASAPAT